MTPPELIAAKLDATWTGWAVLYGRYSRQFVAFPASALAAPAGHAGLITAKDPIELERRMAVVQLACRHAQGEPRGGIEGQRATPPVPEQMRSPQKASSLPRIHGRYAGR
jgi:hypothetical protein